MVYVQNVKNNVDSSNWLQINTYKPISDTLTNSEGKHHAKQLLDRLHFSGVYNLKIIFILVLYANLLNAYLSG